MKNKNSGRRLRFPKKSTAQQKLKIAFTQAGGRVYPTEELKQQFIESGDLTALPFAEHKNTHYGKVQMNSQEFAQACVAWFKKNFSIGASKVGSKTEFTTVKNEHAGAGRGRDRRIGLINQEMAEKLAHAGIAIS